MKARSFFSRFCHTSILRRAAVTLVALAWSSLAFCDEIHDAAKTGDLEKVKALLKANPDLVNIKDTNNFSRTPLQMAAKNGHKDMVELLLANKADVNAKDRYGETALLLAANNGHYSHKDVVELLLANKAEVNATDISGITPYFPDSVCKSQLLTYTGAA